MRLGQICDFLVVFGDRFAECFQLVYDPPNDQYTRLQHRLVSGRCDGLPDELLENGNSRLLNAMSA